jgi:RluA family pseudouridine synthase
MKNWKVTEKESGIKLVAFLRSKLGDGFSSKKLKQAIEKNFCFVNGIIERFASFKLRSGDKVRFDDDALQDIPPIFFTVEKERILYEDETFLFYDKPAGLTCDAKGIVSLFRKFKLVHRLDRDTTGVIVLAKTEHAHQAMIALFKTMKVKKSYLALVDGVLKKKSGIIENYIGSISENENQILWGVVSPKKGKIAKTAWELVVQGKTAALVKCTPITGRTHQIRIHMKELGHPILGDFQYSKKYRCSYHPKRSMLHAAKLSFPHPATGEILQIEASTPNDFKETMEKVLV